MGRELAISIEHVSKEYRLGVIGGGTLQGDLQSWWAKARGKEDPNSKIGSKTYKHNERFLALNDISFDIEKGEAIGLIGHNGAGKSTLLKLISCVTAPTKGCIRLNGKISSMLEVGTGFHPELTGRENIYMNGAILGMKRHEINERMDQIIEFSECSQFIDTPVKRYSSGMYVKLAFSVAAHLNNDILIMDEVLAVGDLQFQRKCLKKMSEVSRQEGKTILYVSHNMSTIRQLCPRCVVLQQGKLLFDGSVSEAVGIYSHGVTDMAVVRDYTDIIRPANIRQTVMVSQLELLDKQNCCVMQNETLRFRIRWRCLDDIRDAYFRFIIKYIDSTTVGMCASQPIVSGRKNSNYETVIEVPITGLVDGRYYMDLYVTQTGNNGSVSNCDVVGNAFSFEVEENREMINRLTWYHNAWGSVMLPEIKIADLQEVNS